MQRLEGPVSVEQFEDLVERPRRSHQSLDAESASPASPSD